MAIAGDPGSNPGGGIVLRDMLERGFEWALQRGLPVNSPGVRYRWQPPCCKLAVVNGKYKCGHAWNVTPGFPLGNPSFRGGPWKGQGPDPGTFEGGTVF
ncbi:hypothetical protein FOA52_009787 [Chlamydomonas sp. UWO 241]|nr:hypothetical protein FOA52_009787 [Chlamydomonas sp. UWO 241]